MKLKNHLSYLLGAVFGSLLSVSAVGCLQSAFGLKASMGNLTLLCVLSACIFALLFRFRYGGTVLLCGAALAVGYLARQGTVIDQTASLLGAVTDHYHAAYGWPMLGSADGGAVELPLAVIGLLAAAAVTGAVGRRKNVLPALIPVILPLAVCLVVTNTVPDAIWLYLLMLGISLLLITDWVRRKGAEQGAKLTAMLALPVAAALGALFLLVPEKNYVNRVEDIQDKLIARFQELQAMVQEMTEESPVGVSAGENRVDLRYVGPKSDWDYPVMRVTSSVGGALYLREQDYNTYGGSGWAASRHRSETFSAGGEVRGQLRIQTYGVRGDLYLPYYPRRNIPLVGGCVENSERVTTYTFELADDPTPSDRETDSLYLQLPVTTMSWAGTLAREVTAECGTREEMAAAIGDYVRQSAAYDLSTERMDPEEKDFARWFLERSDTGYCVHFATAATVLLRAAGIPARYVEGYLITCEAGVRTEVSSKAAHAWAEYYDGGVWRILEATPADLSRNEEAPVTEPVVPQTEAESTRPPETEAATQPAVPEETEAASKPTEPARQENEPSRGGLGWLWVLMLPLAAIGQSIGRIYRKRILRRSGAPNRQALNRYAQLEQLARLLKTELPEEATFLAQKAKFSQHPLTGEELGVLEEYRDTLRQKLMREPLHRRLWLWLVWAEV